MNELTLRRLGRADFPLLASWLSRPHVARWWNHDVETAALERDFGAAIDGTDRADVFIVSVHGRPLGLLQRYTFADNPEYMTELSALLEVSGSALGMDYFIGEPAELRHGLGVEMLRAGARSTWIDYPAAPAIVVPVVAANAASWRALERAGFERVAEGALQPDNPIDDALHYVYRIERPTEPAGRSL